MNAFREFDRPEVIEDNFVRATPKQVNYIEILRNDLQYSIATRNAHIMNILHLSQTVGVPFDIWALSVGQAGQVIGEFKKRKKER